MRVRIFVSERSTLSGTAPREPVVCAPLMIETPDRIVFPASLRIWVVKRVIPLLNAQKFLGALSAVALIPLFIF